MKWHRAPLIRFLAIGAVLFGLHTLFRRSTPDEGNRVEVSLADIDRLRGLWKRQWRRPPTEKELEGLINQFIREEILYREAVAMGLDQNDTVIRRRLAQKMELLSNDLAALAQPTEVEMQQYLEQKPERYGVPARISLSHVYMSRDRRGAAVEDDARHVLHKLRSKSISPGEYRELGDPFMLQYDYPSRSQQDLRELFGTAFAESVFELELGSWHGPVESSYGVHLVLVRERTEPRMPSLSEVRARLRADLLDQRRREMNEAFYAALRERYEVVVKEPAASPPVTDAAQK